VTNPQSSSVRRCYQNEPNRGIGEECSGKVNLMWNDFGNLLWPTSAV
jgi:hypothetical protein